MVFSPNKHLHQGFTLLELLIVIGIIGILSSITIVSYKDYSKKAKLSNTMQWAKSVHSELGAYAVGGWSFDNITGNTVLDDSGNGNNGIIYGATQVDGVVGKALSFDGTDDYINIPNDDSLRLTSNLTITLWAKLTGTIGSNYTFAICKKNTSLSQQAGFQIYYSPYQSGTIDMFGRGNYYKRHTLKQDYDWHHYAAVWKGTELALYQDGKIISGTYHGTPLSVMSGDDDLWINKRDSAYVGYAKGITDDVRIYSEPLSQARIQQLYAQGLKTHRSLAKLDR